MKVFHFISLIAIQLSYATHYSNEIIHIVFKMGSSNFCQCGLLLIGFLNFSKFIGIFPISHVASTTYGLSCSFKTSKFLFMYSVVWLLFNIGYVIYTLPTLNWKLQSTNYIYGYLEILFYIIFNMEILSITICNIWHAKNIAHICEIVTIIPAKYTEVKTTSRKITFVILVIIFGYISYITMKFVDKRTGQNSMNIISYGPSKNYWPKIIIRCLTIWYRNIEVLIIFVLSSLISNKFQYFAKYVEKYIKDVTGCFIIGHNISVINIDDGKKQINQDTMWSLRLMKFNQQYHDLHGCLNSLNQCFGFQLFMLLLCSLVSLIFYVFKCVSIKDESNTAVKIPGAVIQIFYFIILMWIGHRLKNKSREPLFVLQKSDITILPKKMQTQIQSLLLQWSTMEPGYLSAITVINIGPWMLASIISNCVTYLLVFMQYDLST